MSGTGIHRIHLVMVHGFGWLVVFFGGFSEPEDDLGVFEKALAGDEHTDNRDLIDALGFEPLNRRTDGGGLGHPEGDLDGVRSAEGLDHPFNRFVPIGIAAMGHDEHAGRGLFVCLL